MILNQNYYKHRSKESVSDIVINSSVKEILKISRVHLKKKTSKLVVLDVGCGSGEYSLKLEKAVKKVVGVEPFKPAYEKAIKNKKRVGSRVTFVNTVIEDFKTKQKFDLVLSITTIEHMPHVEKSFKHIFSLMNKGGVLYVTAPNKAWPLEQHYHLPFLSWLPRSLANTYIRLAGKGETYDDCSYSLTYSGMKSLFNKFPCKYKFLVPENADVGYLGCGERNFIYNFVLRLGIRLIKSSPFFWNISKGFVLLAIKE